MSPLDSHFATRRRLKVGLTLAGIFAGAVFGVVLTRLGKIVAGAPPATLANYLWNAAVFGAVAGIVSPLVAWSGLRRVPLWRTVTEPLLWAVGGRRSCGARCKWGTPSRSAAVRANPRVSKPPASLPRSDGLVATTR